MRRLSTFRRVFSHVYEDWKEFKHAHQPIPNPPGYKKEEIWKGVLKIPLSEKYEAFKEACELYRLSLTDREKAAQIVAQDEEIIRRLKNPETCNEETSDVDEVIKKVKELIPTGKIETVQDAVNAAYERRAEIKNIAKERLEIMGEALGAFTSGYRESRDASREAVVSDKTQFRDMVDMMLESQQQPNSDSAASSSLKEKKDSGS